VPDAGTARRGALAPSVPGVSPPGLAPQTPARNPAARHGRPFCVASLRKFGGLDEIGAKIFLDCRYARDVSEATQPNGVTSDVVNPAEGVTYGS